MAQSIPERVATTLAELGQAVPTNMIQTTLLRGGYFVGWRVCYDGGYAVLPADSNTIKFFDDSKTLVSEVVLDVEPKAA